MASPDNTKRAQLLQKTLPLDILLIFVAVWGSFYYFFFQHEIQKFLPGGTYHTQTEQQQLRDRQSYLEDLKKLKTLQETYGADNKGALSQIIPATKDVPLIFSMYERVAHEHNLGLQLIDIVSQDASRKDAPGVREMVVALKLTNVDYKRLKELIRDIEKSARLTDVLSFDFDPEAQTLSLNVKLYYFGEKK